MVNKTLGVRIYLDSLINDDSSLKPESLDLIKKVIECVRRICLSTNAAPNFFYLVCVDKRLGYQVIMIRYIPDLMKIMLSSISKLDYAQRMRYEITPSANIHGNILIKDFFKEMNLLYSQKQDTWERKIKSMLIEYFVPGTVTFNEFYAVFRLPELKHKENLKQELITVKSIPISASEELFYCQVKEKYILKEEYEETNLLLADKVSSGYLFLIAGRKIKEIHSLRQPDLREKVIFPPKYKKYQAIEKWPENNFFVEDISFPQFLAYQIAKRVKREASRTIKVKKQSSLIQVTGAFENDETAALILSFNLNQYFMNLSNKNFIAISLKIFKNVCKKYKFFKFKQIRFVNLKNNKEIQTINIEKEFFKRGTLLKEAFGSRDY